MLYTIENKKLSVTVSDLGAELMSVKTKADGCEYLWQGDEKYWEEWDGLFKLFATFCC